MTHRLRWHISRAGNQYAYVGNFLLTIFDRGNSWCVCVKYLGDDSMKFLGPYETYDAARLAGFDLLHKAMVKERERTTATIEAVEPAMQQAGLQEAVAR